MKRYNITASTRPGVLPGSIEITEATNGEWVRYEEIVDLKEGLYETLEIEQNAYDILAKQHETLSTENSSLKRLIAATVTGREVFGWALSEREVDLLAKAITKAGGY